MFTNVYYSDDSDGASRPTFITPRARHRHRSHRAVRAETPSDEEKALVSASHRFGSLRDPFAETPEVPRVVPATTYNRLRAQGAQGTPSRHFEDMPPQAMTRYRSSTAVPSNSVPRSRAGMLAERAHHNPTNNVNMVQGVYDAEPMQEIFSKIMTAIQYVNVSPGVAAQTQTQLLSILREVSQDVNGAFTQLLKQLNDALRGREQEHERFQRASHKSQKLQESMREANELNTSLRIENNDLKVSQIMQGNQVDLLTNHFNLSTDRIQELEREVGRLHKDKDKLIEYTNRQDDQHLMMVAELKNQIQSLRSNINAKGDTNSPNAEKQPSPDASQSAQALVKQTSKRVGFVPDPRARAFSPSGAYPYLRDMGLPPTKPKVSPIETKVSPTESKVSSTESKSDEEAAQSATDVVIFTGRPKPVTIRRCESPSPISSGEGGGVRVLRTPFGIVYGEYPTVEENSRLPGEKKISRDKEIWDIDDVQRALAHLYDLCKGYVATSHMQGEPVVPYNELQDKELATWKFMMTLVYEKPEHASNHLNYLLGTKPYPPYLLQRLCVDYLLKMILNPQVFVGYTKDMGEHLKALQAQLANIADDQRSGTNRNRQRIINDHASVIQTIAGSEDIGEYRQVIVERHASMMDSILEPMRAQGASGTQARHSLRVMVGACWDISVKIWSSGRTLHYNFPECAARFVPDTMEALNQHHFAKSPGELVRGHCRVSLVVTPTMTLRDERDNAPVHCGAIHKAQVLTFPKSGG
ncbi:hypothetical protein F4777DRAFT_599814 [Nemania sp. FL0916]|nr:hypothetical protein F4777DRAFT_599814 [Nemania sp. FL0916]